MIDCLAVPVATPDQANVAEAQLRVDMLGERLVVDGARGALTRAGFRRWEARNHLIADGRITPTDMALLRSQTRGGYSVHVNLDRQVMAVHRGGSGVEIKVSTGSGLWYGKPGDVSRAVTPTGSFRATRKIDGMRQSALGCLQRPIYFLRGWAIHGSNSVPRRPASHGCVRVSMPAAEALFRTVGVGAPIKVSGSNPAPRNTKGTPVA